MISYVCQKDMFGYCSDNEKWDKCKKIEKTGEPGREIVRTTFTETCELSPKECGKYLTGKEVNKDSGVHSPGVRHIRITREQECGKPKTKAAKQLEEELQQPKMF